MRAFIAIELPEEIRHALEREQSRFRPACPGARWTRPEGIHLTLRFLGEISDAQTVQLVEKLKGLEAFAPFTVEVGRFGFFPDARRPRVFWAGVSLPPELVQLAQRIETLVRELGFPPEHRDFRPHLTLARFKSPKPCPELTALLSGAQAETPGAFTVSEYFLWESRLSPAGSEYRKVAKITSQPE